MAKRKSTIYVDEEVLRAARVYAARSDIRDSDVVERALRQFLGFEVLDRAASSGSSLDEADALALAYQEVRAARASAKTSTPQ
jgi:hypothetical protein